MRTSTTRRRLSALTVGMSGLALVAAACSPSTDSGRSADGATTVQNCGLDVSVEGPPERVYAAYQPAIEIAHALDLGDRLVGTAFLDSEVLPEYAEAQKESEYVESLPSRDALLATEPDFVLSGFNGVFAEDGDGTSFGTRGSLAELGVQSWILSPLCPSEDGATDEAIDPATVDLETLHDDIRALGELFDVEEKAEEVIADQVERIEAVQDRVADEEPVRVGFVTIRDDGTYSVAGGIDFGSRIIEAAGGENVFADLTDKRNVDVDVEEIISRDPDVILTSACCDATLTREDAEDEVQEILDVEALSGVSAVREEQVHPFLFADRSAGVRVAHAVELLAGILHPED